MVWSWFSYLLQTMIHRYPNLAVAQFMPKLQITHLDQAQLVAIARRGKRRNAATPVTAGKHPLTIVATIVAVDARRIVRVQILVKKSDLVWRKKATFRDGRKKTCSRPMNAFLAARCNMTAIRTSLPKRALTDKIPTPFMSSVMDL